MTDQPTASNPAKPTSLGRAFQQIGSLTAISRIVGFMRDIAFASFLGAGPAADAFLVALKLPNMFRFEFADRKYLSHKTHRQRARHRSKRWPSEFAIQDWQGKA